MVSSNQTRFGDAEVRAHLLQRLVREREVIRLGGQLESRSRLVQGRGVRIGVRDLLLGERMTTQLEQHHELAQASARGGIGDGRSRVVGGQWTKRVEVEVVAAAVSGHERE